MLYRRGKTWHYDFTVADRRQRGTTHQTSESRARKIESKLMEEAERRGPSAVLRRAPLLCDFAPRFLDWVDRARHLASKSRRYYRVGWNQIRSTPCLLYTSPLGDLCVQLVQFCIECSDLAEILPFKCGKFGSQIR